MSPDTLHSLMLRLAGVERIKTAERERMSVADDNQRAFEAVLAGLAELFAAKSKQYGTSRLEVRADPPDFDIKMVGSDLHRKYLRVFRGVWERTFDRDFLLESLQDLAVYCVMGIVIVLRLSERPKKEGA